MSARLSALVVPVAVAAAYLTFAGAALAGQTSIFGAVPNGGCTVDRQVPVSGPSRIEVVAASTSSESTSLLGEIVAPNGVVVATGLYDTPSGGNYAVRVCSQFSGIDPPSIEYTGLIGTGPAGQPALPRQAAGSASAVPAVHSVTGSGAVATRSGLARFWVTVGANGAASVRYSDPAHHQQQVRLTTGLHAAFGANSVRITGSGVVLVITDNGTSQRLTLKSRRLNVSGTVVRGRFEIS